MHSSLWKSEGCARIHAVHWFRAVENLVLPGIYARSELIRQRIDRYKGLRFQVVSKLAIHPEFATGQGGDSCHSMSLFFWVRHRGVERFTKIRFTRRKRRT